MTEPLQVRQCLLSVLLLPLALVNLRLGSKRLLRTRYHCIRIGHLSDETSSLLVENARQVKEGSGVVVDGEGTVVTE